MRVQGNLILCTSILCSSYKGRTQGNTDRLLSQVCVLDGVATLGPALPKHFQQRIHECRSWQAKHPHAIPRVTVLHQSSSVPPGGCKLPFLCPDGLLHSVRTCAKPHFPSDAPIAHYRSGMLSNIWTDTRHSRSSHTAHHRTTSHKRLSADGPRSDVLTLRCGCAPPPSRGLRWRAETNTAHPRRDSGAACGALDAAGGWTGPPRRAWRTRRPDVAAAGVCSRITRARASMARASASNIQRIPVRSAPYCIAWHRGALLRTALPPGTPVGSAVHGRADPGTGSP